jgi:hypothetical protein
MKWKKLGLIFSAEMYSAWMNSHAQVPTVMNLGDTLRVFFSTRDKKGTSRVAFLDVEARNPLKIKKIHETPVLDVGKAGCFDEHGVMPSCIISNPNDSNETFLYFSGWSRRLEVPYCNLAGIAKSNNGVSFERLGNGPILTTKLYEPYSATSPFALLGKDQHVMYYSSGTSWATINGKLEHTYNIRKAISKDGVNWHQLNEVCLEQKHPEEALTRPTILVKNNVFHMWFCYRGSRNFRDGEDSYRIGYAYSRNGINWIRDDSQAGITVSKNGWDANMIGYPYIATTQYGVYMFYNGNGFGRSGFGVAVLEV